MANLNRLFTEHPRTVNETYFEHMGVATSFGVRMLGASLACLVHGIFPFLFTKTGSRTITELYTEMNEGRVRRPAPAAVAE
ncbi:MAG: DUF6356 family protein [Pseudomonadota bacterium]